MRAAIQLAPDEEGRPLVRLWPETPEEELLARLVDGCPAIAFEFMVPHSTEVEAD